MEGPRPKGTGNRNDEPASRDRIGGKSRGGNNTEDVLKKMEGGGNLDVRDT